MERAPTLTGSGSVEKPPVVTHFGSGELYATGGQPISGGNIVVTIRQAARLQVTGLGAMIAAVKPGDVTALNAVAASSTVVNLSWVNPTTGGIVTSLELNRSLTGTGNWSANLLTGIATSFSDTGRVASTTYHYRLRAVSGTSNGDYVTDSVTTPGAQARTGIIYTMDFSEFGADVTNPQQAQFADVDNRHIAQTGFGFSNACQAAGYHAMTHLQIVSTNPVPPNGGRCAKCTLYYAAVDYTTGNYQPFDKPRVDFNTSTLLARDAEYWAGFAIWLPANYVEDTTATAEIYFQGHSSTDPAATNYFQCNISGAAGGATWRVECMNHGNATANDNDPVPDQRAFTLTTPVAAIHKGEWTYHVLNWKININNPAQNKMRWWLTQEPSLAQAAIFKTNAGTRWGTQSDDFIRPSMNYYKSGWRNDGSYNGNKTGNTVMALGEMRLGSVNSNYLSVHPTMQSEP